MRSGVATFLREKYPYFVGFAVIEAGIYYFNGPTGNFTTGFLGLFAGIHLDIEPRQAPALVAFRRQGSGELLGRG